MALPKGQGVIPLPPFKAWLASNIPGVYDNTLSYYEELVDLIKYLQDTVVPAVNHNAEALTVVSNALEQLKQYVDDYFENLDVQEEINNKLDEMAAAGTLQEIITAYIQANVAWTFNTVADMQNATNLVNGSFAQTLGFNAVGDGGGAIYKITDTGTADGIFTFAVGNLYATAVNGGVKHISIGQLENLTDGVYTLGEVDVESAINLPNVNNRKITIVGTKFNIKTSVMLPAPATPYWIMPSFVGCTFNNATSDNSRVLITSGGSNTVGSAFTSCKFIKVDLVTGNNYVQDMAFTDCYIESHTCFIDEHDKTVQARFTRCDVESPSNKLILAKDGLFYFSGTYEGNINKDFYFVDIESRATLTLDNCWLEGVKFLNLVGSTSTSGSADSIININGCKIQGGNTSTPQMYITNGGHVNLYINGSTFDAYDMNSRFCNLGYSDFRKVVGDFSSAYAYGKPFGELTGSYDIATLKDLGNLENKYFVNKDIILNSAAIAAGGVPVDLPLGNYLMVFGGATYGVYNNLNSTLVAIIGGSPSTSSTNTSKIDLHNGSSMSQYTITVTKTNASDTTFRLNIQSSSPATGLLSLVKL